MKDEGTSFRGLLLKETGNARLIRVVDREIWIPKSVCLAFRKNGHPDTNGHIDVRVEVEDWFATKNDL